MALALALVNYYHSASIAGTPHEPASWCRESIDFQTVTLSALGGVGSLRRSACDEDRYGILMYAPGLRAPAADVGRACVVMAPDSRSWG